MRVSIRRCYVCFILILLAACSVSITEAPPLDVTSEATETTPTPSVETVRIIDAQPAESYPMLDWSPDGRLLAVSGNAPTVRIFDTQTLELINEFRSETMTGARFTQFSPDAHWLMVDEITEGAPIEGGAIPVYFDAVIWNPTTGERVEQLTTRRGVWHGEWSPFGDLLAYSDDLDKPRILFWAPPGSDAEVPATIQLTDFIQITDLVWQADGTIVVSGEVQTDTGSDYAIWLSSEAQELQFLEPSPAEVTGYITLSPDASMASMDGWMGQLYVVDTHSGEVLHIFEPAPTYRVSGLGQAFSSDNTLFAVGSRDQVVIYDLPTGGLVARLTGHESEVVHIAFSPDGQTLAVAEADGKVRLWYLPAVLLPPATPTLVPTITPAPVANIRLSQVTTLYAPVPPPTEEQTTGALTDLHWLDNNTLRSTVAEFTSWAEWGRIVADHDIASGQVIYLAHTDGNPYSVSYPPDSSRYAIWDGGNLDTEEDDRIFIERSAPVETLFELPGIGAGNHFAWSPDGTQLVVGRRKSLDIYDGITGDTLMSLGPAMLDFEGVGSLAYSPNGRWIVIASQGPVGSRVIIWDAATYNIMWEFREPDDSVTTLEVGSIYHVAFSPDSAHLMLQRSERMDLLDMATLQVQSLPQPRDRVAFYQFAEWSADSRYIAVDAQVYVGGPKIVVVWDTQTSQSYIALERSANANDPLPNTLQWSPNESLLVTSDVDGLHLIDADTGGVALFGEGYEIDPYVLAWSPDGQYLAVGINTGEIQLWEIHR